MPDIPSFFLESVRTVFPLSDIINYNMEKLTHLYSFSALKMLHIKIQLYCNQHQVNFLQLYDMNRPILFTNFCFILVTMKSQDD